jgi:hypothetical protein
MVASAYIHGSKGIVSLWFVCFVGKFTSLSSLLFSFHGKSRSFVMNWFNGFYGGKKLERLGLQGANV